MAIVTPYSKLTALVVDDMATQQTTLRGQLTMLGVAKVDVAANAEDAIRLLRSKPYGLVLCDYNLNHKTDGQQLFEFAREQGLLGADCLFFMVTAENAYASVAAASEDVPDAYLLKPITAGDIEERLKIQLERRRALAAIHARQNKQDLPGALAACEDLLARKDRWFVQALQLKGQVLLQLGRHEDAKTVYTSVLNQRPQLVWAQLGLARSHRAAGRNEECKLVAYDIIGSKEGGKNVAAYDFVAEALEAQGDIVGAQGVLSDAASVVPSSKRLRLFGECAYRNGDLDTAKECFAKVSKATRGAVTAQAQDTLALAQTLIDRGELSEALGLLDDGSSLQRNNAQYEPVAMALRAQAQSKAGDSAAAAKSMARARQALRTTKADFATVALAKAEILGGDAEAGLERLKGAIGCDHENAHLKSLVRKVLGDTGHEDKTEQLITGAAAELEARVAAAKQFFRDGRTPEALAAIEQVVKAFPDNTGVLLQAAQMNCLSLRLNKRLDAAVVERVRLYLARLDKSLAGHDRVALMRRYYLDTLTLLEGAAVAA